MTPGGESMDGWTYYGRVATFHRSDRALRAYRQPVSAGGQPHSSIEALEAEGLLAEPLSGFLYILQRVASPPPSRRHMDHLNGPPTHSSAIDVETKEKQ